MKKIFVAEKDNEIKKCLLSLKTINGRKIGMDKDVYYKISDDADDEYDIVIYNNEFDGKIKTKHVCMVNSDEKIYCKPGDVPIISCGLNSLATVTASSICDDFEGTCFQYCLQRNILNLEGKIIEPQEFPVKVDSDFLEIHSALFAVTLGLLCDEKITVI